ncbi:ATP-binding protein [Actinomycetospora endophytica]|uniref:histidine kinase n=1 Tax=Actinomycetospora endophytica TaxID=2291215 RepID=A0ABS8PF21_9PSEU|nr:ATP-binding protein [Actinomycetospora endophytica]MCD2196855.1 ATP-binding protein [Actinomycetospora endophytica]
MLSDAEWRRRHHFLLWVLGLHIPFLAVFGLAMGWSVLVVGAIAGYLALIVLAAALVRRRHPASWLVTLGLTSCSVALVCLSHGAIEAHFHFFVIVGFLALYQDWFPFLWNIAFTVVSHGVGAAFAPDLIFDHHAGQTYPWLWALIHGVSVLAACVGVLVFWRFSEDVQIQRTELTRRLTEAELNKKQFTSDLLLNLARRNQSMFARQLEIINDLEDKERDPDVLGDLFRLDHLATRVRRNAENLLVLSGEQPARVWSEPVPLRDVVRAAIAETEDLDRVVFSVDEHLEIVGSAVADLTHLLAELTENAVHFSPPTSTVTMQSRAYAWVSGSHLLVIEDTGVGMPAEDLAAANELLAEPQDVDLSASRRLGFHVVTRLAQRHDVEVSLAPTPGSGVTAVIILPPALFASSMTPPRGSVRPALLSGAQSEKVSAPSAETFSASRLGEPAEMAPITVGVNGRHGWPGAPDVEHAGRREAGRTATHASEDRRLVSAPGLVGAGPVSALSPVPATRRTGKDRHDPASDPTTGPVRTSGLPTRTPGRTALIRPKVVPPPPLGGDGTTAARDGATADAPAPRRSTEGGAGGRPTLKRRVPQSHLASELTSPGAAPSASAPPAGSRPAGPGPDMPDTGALDALSRYQASRQRAHAEIDGTDGPDGAGSPDHPGAGPDGDPAGSDRSDPKGPQE